MPPIVTFDEAMDAVNATDMSSSDQSELQDLIDGITEVVENIVGAITSDPVTEFYDGGSDTIVLKSYPVLTVASVTEYTPTGTVLTAEPFGTDPFTDNGYRLNSETGVLTRTSGGQVRRFAVGDKNVQVVYTPGRGTVPASVRSGAKDLLRLHWQPQQSGNLPGIGNDEFGAGETVLGYYVPYKVMDQLTPHRTAPKVGAA